MHSYQLETMSVVELQNLMVQGRLTAVELVNHCLERIALYDRQGPELNTVMELNPEAVLIATALDREREVSGARGVLHGIPVLVKDNISTKDMMHTSAGSLALANFYASKDAFIVKRLRAAGAIILGKANMTEWANFMTKDMPNGYSSRGGQVKNPYGPGWFDVGGSSSGSGAAVAAELVPLAVGTETSGSILSPAHNNSVVGIKPTVGLVSRNGVIPISFSQDTAGPLAKTVEDAAVLLNALSGIDDEDIATSIAQGLIPEDYTSYLVVDGLVGARLGVLKSAFERLDEAMRDVMYAAIEECKRCGATIIDSLTLPSREVKLDYTVLTYEFKPALNSYFNEFSNNAEVKSLSEVIAFNFAHPQSALKYNQILLLEAEGMSGTLTEPEYINARRRDICATTVNGIDSLIAEHHLDALLLPGSYQAGISARAGYPSICVPAGYTEVGRPCGLTFTNRAFTEPLLLKLAYSFEQASKHRRSPKLVDNVTE